jgi:hypothetical protein
MRRDFFYEEEKAGATPIGVTLGGTDWLGLSSFGTALQQSAVGTEMCGAKPTCISFLNKSCQDQKDAFNKCVQQSLTIDQQNKMDANKKKVIIWVVAGVSAIALVTIYMLLRRRKRKAGK